jgi:hypothetical protein
MSGRVKSDFADKVLLALDRDHGINEDSVARGLVTAIRGETIREIYGVSTDPQTGARTMDLHTVIKSTKPRDVLAGAMIFDALSGGRLGLTRHIEEAVSESRGGYERFRPSLPAGANVNDVIARPGEDVGFSHPIALIDIVDPDDD